MHQFVFKRIGRNENKDYAFVICDFLQASLSPLNSEVGHEPSLRRSCTTLESHSLHFHCGVADFPKRRMLVNDAYRLHHTQNTSSEKGTVVEGTCTHVLDRCEFV